MIQLLLPVLVAVMIATTAVNSHQSTLSATRRNITGREARVYIGPAAEMPAGISLQKATPNRAIKDAWVQNGQGDIALVNDQIIVPVSRTAFIKEATHTTLSRDREQALMPLRQSSFYNLQDY